MISKYRVYLQLSTQVTLPRGGAAKQATAYDPLAAASYPLACKAYAQPSLFIFFKKPERG